ncbi:MAG: arsenic resistance N-acetyltransferase ArsN2 [Gammaproteobacteria bacterium]
MDLLQSPPRDRVVELLEQAGLPFSDISEKMLENYFGCGRGGQLCGTIGLETHDEFGLLRSLAVSPACRGSGCGVALVNALESHAKAEGITSLYLLTETAERFFARLGYTNVSREEVPEPIKTTREFRSLCPETAIVMGKSLRSD